LTRLALSPLALLRGLAKNRDLIGVLAAREVKQRFQGSILGVGWSLLVPLVTLVMYTAVFAGVFKLRWPGSQGGPLEFALMVFVGLLVHGFLAECLNRSPALLVGNVNYIKKVVFPLEILAVTMIAPALFNFLAGIVVLLVFAAAVKQALPWTAIWLPLVMAPLVLIGLGIAWIVHGPDRGPPFDGSPFLEPGLLSTLGAARVAALCRAPQPPELRYRAGAHRALSG
jgi:lipopolysaccharide transport system permease protein